jgi:hypothetical protein
MGTESEKTYPRQQFFAAKAEQAELRASECDDQSVHESWILIANSWRLLAENYAEGLKL